MGGKYRVPYELLGPHFDDPFDTQIPEFLRTAFALDDDDDDDDDSMDDKDWLVGLHSASSAARCSALLGCTMSDDSVACPGAAAGGVLEIDRSRGLRTPETTTSTCTSRRCVNDVLAAPGRNRSTDTRICKTAV